MNICFVVDSYKPIYDGVVRYFDLVIPALVEEGYNITVVCPHIPGTKKFETPYEGLEVVRCFSPGFQTQGYYVALPDKHLIRAIKKSDYVVIHSLATLGVIGGFIARFYKKKTGLFVHQDERLVMLEMLNDPLWITNFTVSLISEIFYPFFIDAFFCATERFKGKLLDYKVPEEKIFFTPFAIDSQKFSPDNNSIDIRKRHNIPKDAIVSLYVGRISVEKNITNLILALDKAMEEEPNLYGLFVGKQTDMSLIPKNLKNTDRMIFAGFVQEEELPCYYAHSDFFSSPSLNESTCFTVFEAMSSQLPVITSEYRHDKDIIDNENAILVKNLRNVDSIKEKILLLARDEQLRKKIGINGRKLINTRTWKNNVQEFTKGVKFAFSKGKKRRKVRRK